MKKKRNDAFKRECVSRSTEENLEEKSNAAQRLLSDTRRHNSNQPQKSPGKSPFDRNIDLAVERNRRIVNANRTALRLNEGSEEFKNTSSLLLEKMKREAGAGEKRSVKIDVKSDESEKERELVTDDGLRFALKVFAKDGLFLIIIVFCAFLLVLFGVIIGFTTKELAG